MSDAVRIASRQSFALLWSSKIHKPATGLAGLPGFQPPAPPGSKIGPGFERVGAVSFLRQSGAGSVAASPPDLAGFLRSIALKALGPGPLCRNEPFLEKASDQVASFGDFHLNTSRRDHVHDRGS